jgi:Type I phosphodiesterase / nucleotide pyrophosphatase
MSRVRWIVLSIIVLALIAYGSFTWVNALLDSMFAYRSPLRASPPAPGAALGQPMTSRVVLVIVDALRDDTSRKPDVMPFLNELRGRGAWATMRSQPPSWSEPSWTTIGTGAWPEINDAPPINLEYDKIWPWTQDNIFAAAKRAGLKTAVSGYNWWEKFISSDLRDAGFFTYGEDDAADRDVVNAAMPWLTGGGYQLVLIHLDQVDYAGHHQGGPRDPRWNAAATRADGMLKQIAGALDFKKDALIVLSDHGQIDRGGHGGQDPIALVEPFVMTGSGVKPGQYPDVKMVDIAPTIAVLLGTNIPASSEGKPLTQMLDVDVSRQTQINAAWNGQQDGVASAYEKAIGAPRQSGATAQERIAAAQHGRQVGADLLRLVITLVVTLVGAGVLIWKRSRDVAMFLLAAVLYVALYNVIFAVITGNVYSMSTVPIAGATAFVIQIAEYTLIAVIPAWFVAMLFSGAFRRGALHAAQATYGFAFITLYLLFLPALLGFAVNGAMTTWRLPDPLLIFLHFTNLIQAMFVAALGIVLSGVAAFIGWRSKSGSPVVR